MCGGDGAYKHRLLTTISGVLFGVGWWFLIDGAVYANSTDDNQQVKFQFVIVGIVASFALWLLNAFPWSALSDSLDEKYATRSKCALFLSVSLLIGCVLGSIWILVAVYAGSNSVANSKWPGAAILIQNVLILVAAVVMRVGRSDSL